MADILVSSHLSPPREDQTSNQTDTSSHPGSTFDIEHDDIGDTYDTDDEVLPYICRYASLRDLFNSVDYQVSDVYNICVALRPFVVAAIGRAHESNTSVLREVLEFIDDGVTRSQEPMDDNKWSCTNGQLHAIVHLLNSDQFLFHLDGEPDVLVQDTEGEDIRTGPSISNQPAPVQFKCQTAEDDADDAFMKELSLLACESGGNSPNP